MYNVLALFKAPAPYFAPLFRMLAEDSDIKFTVVYCNKTTEDGVHYTDYATGKSMSWGLNVLDGYDYFFLNDKVTPCGLPEHKVRNFNIKKVIKSGNYDAILLATSYWSLTTWLLIRAAKKKKIPIITRATVQTTKSRGKVLLALKKIIVGKYCKKMTAGVYECLDQKNYLIHYGMKSDSLFYAPCAVDNAFFRGLALQNDRVGLRQEFGIPDNRIVIITTGRIVPVKRPWDLVHAYENLINKGYDVSLFLVGDGPMREEIEAYCKDNNLDGIYLTGNVTQADVCKYLSISDIFVLSSESDASPKSLNEAMNFALPIVITDGVSTAPELLKEGINGYIYSPGDVDNLVSSIEKIINSDNKDKMGAESLSIVSDNGFERIITGWKDAIVYSLSL
ncbi:MAG: glycosyltransferase family 4 protein [Clostridia bacterium]|nr:glycosyltransferase family 4 protein [Clostridia bacterium]